MIDLSIVRRMRNNARVAARAAAKPVPILPGTYTPTYLGATTAGVTTYTTQAGFYTRIGRVVFFNGHVVWTAATGTGVAIVSIPFTTLNTAEMRYVISLRTDGVTFANNNIVGLLAPNVSAFSMTSLLTNAAPTNVNVEAAGDIFFTGWFNAA